MMRSAASAPAGAMAFWMWAVTLLFLSASPTIAQEGVPAEPVAEPAIPLQGIWWGISVGGAGTRLTCDLCQASRDLGPTVQLSLGSYASPSLRVGIEGGGWTHEQEESREKVYRGGVVAYLRPNLQRGIYLSGGLGWSTYRSEEFRYDAPSVSVGIGWDHALGQTWRIGNQLSLEASSFGSIKNGDTTIDRNVGMSLVRVSIQLYRL